MFGRCRERRTAESTNRVITVQRCQRADSNGAIVVSTAGGGVIIPFQGGMGGGSGRKLHLRWIGRMRVSAFLEPV